MAEWSNAAVLKTVVPQGTGGSNPSLSAIYDLVIDGEFVSDWKNHGLYLSAGAETTSITTSQLLKFWITRTQYIAGLLFLTWAGPRLFAVMGVLCGIFRKQRSMLTGVAC